MPEQTESNTAKTVRIDQAVILCGGLGTRLGDLTRRTPKALLPVADEPFLYYLVREIARQGVSDIVLLAAFESDQIMAFASELPSRLGIDLRLRVSVEPERAGTGGALFHAAALLHDHFYMLNGDSWFDIGLSRLGRLLADDDQAIGALALRLVVNADRYGVVECAEGRITRFGDKAVEADGAALINGGVYAFRRNIVDHLAPNCSLETDVFPQLAAAGRLSALSDNGFFLDIGIPSDFALAQTAIPSRTRRPAAFLDRDGVINVDHGHVGKVDQFAWVDGAPEAIALLNAAGYFVFVVTNQAGIGKGLYSETDYRALRRHIRDELVPYNAWIDDERHCPYHPDAIIEQYRQASDWRKPAPGMLLDLIECWPVNLMASWLIGDKPSDIAAAEAAGISGHLFSEGRLDDFVRNLVANRDPSESSS